MICKCGATIHPKRVELGFTFCVECSPVQKASGHLVVHHKTGNEYQIIKDPETAAKMASMSSRNGFGSNRRAVAKDTKEIKKIIKPAEKIDIVPTELSRKPADSSKWADEAWTLAILDKLSSSKEEAKALLDLGFNKGEISPLARKRLLVILT